MALPRDGEGLPDSSGVRYLARRYLEAEHGWVVKGLDIAPWLRDGRNASQAAALRASELLAVGSELATSGPLLAALSPEPGGFTLRRAAEVVLALEDFLASHDAALMRRAVALSKMINVAPAKKDGEQGGRLEMQSEVEKALLFYAVLIYTDSVDVVRGPDGPELVIRIMQELEKLSSRFATDMVGEPLELITAAAVQKATAYPSLTHSAFGAMRHLRSMLYERHARRRCPRLRGVLSSMDREGSGQVEFRQAYATRVNNWHFTETPEYLDAVGALAEKGDKSGGLGVLIPNYVSGINSCESLGAHPTMLCCPNECEADILPRLEAAVAGPRIAPKQVWAALSRLIKGNKMATADKRKELHSQLRALGLRSGDGLVEIHGRRLGRWLHRAFPHKCRGPTARGSPTVVDPTLSPTAWIEAGKFLPTDFLDMKILRVHLQNRMGPDGTGMDPHSFAARSAMDMDQELQLIHKLYEQRKTGGPPVQQALDDALNVRVLDRSAPAEHLLAAILAIVLLGPLAAVVALMGGFPADVCSFLGAAAAATGRLRFARPAAPHPREGSDRVVDVGHEGPRWACQADPAVTEKGESTDAEDLGSMTPASEYSVAGELSAEYSDSESETARLSTKAGRGCADDDDDDASIVVVVCGDPAERRPRQTCMSLLFPGHRTPDLATRAQREADPQETPAAAEILTLAEEAGARQLSRLAAFPMGFQPPPGLEPPPGLQLTFEAIGLEPDGQSPPILDLTVLERPSAEEHAPTPPHECSVPYPRRLAQQASPNGTRLVSVALVGRGEGGVVCRAPAPSLLGRS